MNEIEVLTVCPLLFDIVDDELEVIGDPIWLDWGKVNTEDLGRRVLVGRYQVGRSQRHMDLTSQQVIAPTFNCPDAGPCTQIDNLGRTLNGRKEQLPTVQVATKSAMECESCIPRCASGTAS